MNSVNHQEVDKKEIGICTYVWIDASGISLRSKTRTFVNPTNDPNDFPLWLFDGSSTGQADCLNSDVYISPVAVFNDPFLKGCHKIVLCQTLNYQMIPLPTNHRFECVETFRKFSNVNRPLFGIEQEYLILKDFADTPNEMHNGLHHNQSSHYCGIGLLNAPGRELCDKHTLACIDAGINIYGTNAEVALNQWEFQIGPCEGITLGDHLWAARYILQRLAEKLGLNISYDPKFDADVNGSGAHINFSTEEMRNPGGIKYINEAIEKLAKRHHLDILNYDLHNGKDNIIRLTGMHETSDYKKFTSNVADRSVSVRIPRQVYMEGKGYLEDRRPASNVDPYLLMSTMIKTIGS